MSADAMIIVCSSLGLASIFLALVINLADRSPKEIFSSVANMSPGARREARISELNNMTKIADQAIEARKLGRRINPMDADY